MDRISEIKYNGIVIFGEMAVGKDTLADYLISQDKRYAKYNIGNAVRQFSPLLKVSTRFRGRDRALGQSIADKLREIYPDLLNDYCLSMIYTKWEKEFGWNNKDVEEKDFQPVLLNQLSQVIKREIPIIVGGRTSQDFQYWTNMNFLTVGLTCDFETKFRRLCLRDGEEAAQNSNFNHNTESEVGNIAQNKCLIVIDNSYDLDNLYKKANSILNTF
jgi:dephospho-CoA kinase